METKPIKVHLDTYRELDAIRVKSESFDNVLKRLLKIHRTLSDISATLGPHHYLMGPNPPSSRNPLPMYCTLCRQPLPHHLPGCLYSIVQGGGGHET